MKLTTNLLKDPRTLAITMAASAFLLAAMAIYQTSTTKTQRIAVADMQSIMDAQKLVWVHFSYNMFNMLSSAVSAPWYGACLYGPCKDMKFVAFFVLSHQFS